MGGRRETDVREWEVGGGGGVTRQREDGWGETGEGAGGGR